VTEPVRKVLGNRYELRTLLAAGGMGQVWGAQDELLGRPVAVKVLRSEYTGDEVFLARFRSEAQHAAALSHPNIAAVYDYGEEPAVDGSDEHLAYLVMELVEGESLSAELARVGRLSPDRTLDVLRQTAAALAAAHDAGVVHRDVKPGNVLVRRDGVVKITDFGIAWSAGSVPLTKTGQVVGTASYLSPEQAAGAHASAASDVYSLGMVGYECLTGRRAFDGDNSVTIALRHLRDQPEPLPDDVPAGIRTLVERAIVKDPAQRYPDGAAVVTAVDEVLAGRQLPPVQRTDTQSFWLLPDAAAHSGASTARAAAPAGGSRMGRLLVPVLALLVGAGVATAVLQTVTPGGDTTATAAAIGDGAPTTSTSEPVDVRADDYLGRPVAAVQAQLEGLGLVVQLEEVPTGEAEPGSVVDVASLADGTTVVVSYAVTPETAAAPSSSTARRSTEQVVQRPVDTPDAAPMSVESTPAPATTAPAPVTAAPTPTTSAPVQETTEPVQETTPEETTPVEEPEPTEGAVEPTDPADGETEPTPSTTTPTPTAGDEDGEGHEEEEEEEKGPKGTSEAPEDEGEVSAQA